MTKMILVLGCAFLTIIAPFPVYSKTSNAVVTSSIKANAPVTVIVNGLVCSFCAQGITKLFMELPQVQTVKVSLEKKSIALTLKPNSVLTDQQIETTVQDAGYTLVRINR